MLIDMVFERVDEGAPAVLGGTTYWLIFAGGGMAPEVGAHLGGSWILGHGGKSALQRSVALQTGRLGIDKEDDSAPGMW